VPDGTEAADAIEMIVIATSGRYDGDGWSIMVCRARTNVALNPEDPRLVPAGLNPGGVQIGRQVFQVFLPTVVG